MGRLQNGSQLMARSGTKKDGEDDLCGLATLCWGIWQARNELIHMGNPRGYEEVVKAALSNFNTYKELSMERQVLRMGKDNINVRSLGWSPPEYGLVKIIVDAGFMGGGIIGFGVIIRNHGDVLMAASYRQRAQWDATLAEVKAIHYALKLTEALIAWLWRAIVFDLFRCCKGDLQTYLLFL